MAISLNALLGIRTRNEREAERDRNWRSGETEKEHQRRLEAERGRKELDREFSLLGKQDELSEAVENYKSLLGGDEAEKHARAVQDVKAAKSAGMLKQLGQAVSEFQQLPQRALEGLMGQGQRIAETEALTEEAINKADTARERRSLLGERVRAEDAGDIARNRSVETQSLLNTARAQAAMPFASRAGRMESERELQDMQMLQEVAPMLMGGRLAQAQQDTIRAGLLQEYMNRFQQLPPELQAAALENMFNPQRGQQVDDKAALLRMFQEQAGKQGGKRPGLGIDPTKLNIRIVE